MPVSVGILLKELPSGELVAVCEQSLGVDVTAGRATPLREGIRLHVSFDDADIAPVLELVDRLLRGRLPLVERRMPGAIGEQSSKRLVVLAAEPRETGDLHVSEIGLVVHEGVQ